MPAPAPLKKTLPVPQAAREIHKKIADRLAALEGGGFRSCLEPGFRKAWGEVLGLVSRYQEEIVRVSRMTTSCSAGCVACCFHWVEDVNSFEAEILAAYLGKKHAGSVGRIAAQCRRDEKALERLNAIVEEKLGGERNHPLAAALDPVDLLLASFYRLRRPCPLLENGRCLAYPVRPLTCRMYVSFSAPERCDPDYLSEEDIPTYLFDLEEEADTAIDRLHFRYQKFENVTGLRSLLERYLSVR